MSQFQKSWSNRFENDFRAVGKSSLSVAFPLVTTENALLTNAEKQFKAVGKTFEIGSNAKFSQKLCSFVSLWLTELIKDAQGRMDEAKITH